MFESQNERRSFLAAMAAVPAALAAAPQNLQHRPRADQEYGVVNVGPPLKI